MAMKRLKKRRGSAYLLVIVILIAISVFTSLMITMLNRSIFHMNTYALQMRAYYLNREAQETVAAVLLDDDADLLQNMDYPRTDSMTHEYDGQVLGESTITVDKEIHRYYGDDTDWIVAHVETTIPDTRPDRAGKSFPFNGTVMILLDNPVVQLYNISPESLDE